jgi:hypothetical protein
MAKKVSFRGKLIYLSTKFGQHKNRAERYGIPFYLTKEQWWKIWKDSGHWNERGPHPDEYCMARKDDKGAYEIGNVLIITNAQNRAMQKNEFSVQHRASLSAAAKRRKPRIFSDQARANMSAARIGKRLSLGHRVKLSAAATRQWAEGRGWC